MFIRIIPEEVKEAIEAYPKIQKRNDHLSLLEAYSAHVFPTFSGWGYLFSLDKKCDGYKNDYIKGIHARIRNSEYEQIGAADIEDIMRVVRLP